ncbi:MAG: universal stress protein [Bacteroidales bacterium]|jgi:nucleotide-binding universal stress UspA family protein|nr:universal stress protein [Bacteroidales bacterium]
MKNVIVGIDFSECSLNAMHHAVSLADKFEARLTLLFVIAPDAKALVGEDTITTNIIAIVEPKLKALQKECLKKMHNPNVEYKIRIGKISRELSAEATEQGDAFIVVGTHGCSGFEEVFIGTSAFKTIEAAQCPVLSIRAGRKISKHLTDILLIIDDTHETLQKLPIAAELAQAFQSKLHIVGLYTGNFKTLKATVNAYVQIAENYLVNKNLRIESVLVKNTSTKLETVLEQAEKHSVNLIILMKEIELDGENVLGMTPFCERMVNRSPIPILALNIKKEIY